MTLAEKKPMVRIVNQDEENEEEKQQFSIAYG